MKKTKIFPLLLCIILVIGCSKNYIDIEFPSDGSGSSSSDGSSSDNNSGTSLVSFNAYVESLNLTRSMTPIQTNIIASIYAYDSISSNLATSSNYQSNSLGTLTGLNGYKMFLDRGTYDFYSVSTNSDETPPTFSNFVSSQLKNNIDYLWWDKNNTDVLTGSVNFDIVFTHRASQIVLNISAGDGIVLDSLESVFTTAPREGTTMNLRTGVITPAISIQSGFVNQMGLNGTVAQSIFLPINNWKFMAVAITAYVNSNETSNLFGAQIPIPNDTLAAGNSYQYSLFLTADSVSVGSVEVQSWTIVKDGKPIYPTEL